MIEASYSCVHFICSIGHATLTLFWTLFGMIGIDILSLPANQRVQQIAGVGMFVLFHLLAVLVLLNALIAVMSNVYNAVEVCRPTSYQSRGH